jgi:hypothetical protein
VGIPYAVNHYKEFLRGQNHYDTYLLSRRLGSERAVSFYYPDKAKANCAECHMPLQALGRFRRQVLRHQRLPGGPQPSVPGGQHRVLAAVLPADPDKSEAIIRSRTS